MNKMIDKFCDYITKKIKEKNPDMDEEKTLVVDFGVKLIFGELPKILFLFITIEPLYIKYTITALIGILAIVLIAKYAPADTEYIPIISKNERKRKKISGFISLAILITIIIFVPDKVISNMLLYGVFMQTLTITRIAYKITNNKYGHEEYEKEQQIAA